MADDATLTVTGGTLRGGWAGPADTSLGGGVIYNAGTVTLNAVHITNCKSVDGGAVKNAAGATLTMNGGSIRNCESLLHGGGAIVNYGTVTITGDAIITDNICKTDGGGIWNNGILNMQGNINILSNWNDNVYLKTGKVINVTGPITSGKNSIGTNVEDFHGVITSGYSTSGTTTCPFFASGIDNITEADGECRLNLCYFEASWNQTTKKVDQTIKAVPADAKVYNLCSSMFASGGDLTDSRWYVVKGNGATTHGLTCGSGDRHIILFQCSEINIKNGIFVPGDATLYIHSQYLVFDYNMGHLIADSKDEKYHAGIGGKGEAPTGRIIIQGGNIDATGGEDAAGIGGGDEDDAGFKEICIYDGLINATGGENGAGIGYGDDNDQNGTINIYGGTVNCWGGSEAAGLGGGPGRYERGDFYINIYEGIVCASGGKKAAGIGQGCHYGTEHISIYGGVVNAWGGKYAAGIGAGWRGNANTALIEDGHIWAWGGDYGAGIGSGQEAYYGHQDLTINGGEVHAYGGVDGAGIGSGERIVAVSLNGGNLTVNGGHVYADGTDWGAGIGGGEDSDGATVVINGGIVEASAGASAAEKNGCAIGSEDGDDHRGTLTIAANMMVHAGQDASSATIFPAATRVPACFYRPYTRIEPCTHDGATVTIVDGSTHETGDCNYCLVSQDGEKHVFGEDGKCLCGLLSLKDDAANTAVL